jgi:hypothetical protein
MRVLMSHFLSSRQVQRQYGARVPQRLRHEPGERLLSATATRRAPRFFQLCLILRFVISDPTRLSQCETSMSPPNIPTIETAIHHTICAGPGRSTVSAFEFPSL